jgi:hypothetical protein
MLLIGYPSEEAFYGRLCVQNGQNAALEILTRRLTDAAARYNRNSTD